MFRVVVQLEGQPPSNPPQSSATSNRFSSRILLDLAPSIFPSTLTSFPVPAEGQHLHSMMLPLLFFMMGCVFLQKLIFFFPHLWSALWAVPVVLGLLCSLVFMMLFVH
ncbi:hypothetical protein AMECASPLE_024287 [Ameca splendens]|uniref:Transmembrane protein n=1 Tax=Ameca splendens TaxID=208324 RepID=A0ABV0Z2B2_9TELE